MDEKIKESFPQKWKRYFLLAELLCKGMCKIAGCRGGYKFNQKGKIIGNYFQGYGKR